MNLESLDTIVFSGGGTRGLSYIGTLMAFQDIYNKTPGSHFKTFVGTSVGAIFALVSLLDIDLEKALGLFETIGLEKIFDRDVTWLLTNFALSNGDTLKGLLESILGLRALSSSVTFYELYEKTKKRLVITVVDLLTASVVYLDHENQGRDMPIVKALLGSMALPPLFPPVHYSFGGSQLLMSDGGLLDNFPVAKWDPQTTLGIRTTWYIDPSVPTTDVYAYYTRVLSILQLTMHVIQSTVASDYPNVLCIDLGPLKAQDISVDMKQLIFQGYRASMAYFSTGRSTNDLDLPTKYLAASRASETLPMYLQKLQKLRKKRDE